MDRRDKGHKVYIGNLPPDAEARDLRDFFRDFGTLNDAWVARKPPGFGFAWFDDERDAIDACKDLDGRHCCGNRVRVEVSNPRGGGGGRDRRDDRRRSPPRGRYGRSPSPRGYRGGGGGRRSRSRSRSRDRGGGRSPRARSPFQEDRKRNSRSPPPRDRSPVKERSPPPKSPRDDEPRRERDSSP